MSIVTYLDPSGCPETRPHLETMGEGTRALHEGINARNSAEGETYLHPNGPSVQVDLGSSSTMTEWQERKGAATMLGEESWSELPQIYARYGTRSGQALIDAIKELESASSVVLTDSGMQAIALTFDALIEPGCHALVSLQVYNKSKAYLRWLGERMDLDVSIVDGLDATALDGEVREKTRIIFVETFTNPLMRALEPAEFSRAVENLRGGRAPNLRCIVDNTIASPWGVKKPLLSWSGIDAVVNAGTKAVGGQDRDMFGYVASTRLRLINRVMDLQAMRGGVVSWRAARAVVDDLSQAKERFERRCANAAGIAEFLASHPKVSEVFHPSLPDHPDAQVVAAHYALPGSIVSFRLQGADEDRTRRFTDALATCGPIRYALSFDGLVTKVNHHTTVSEFYTPPAALKAQGIDRLVRLGLGVEDPEDLIACLNWSLWHGR